MNNSRGIGVALTMLDAMRNRTMHEATHPFTAEELERRPDIRCELVEGRLVEVSPVGPASATTLSALDDVLDLSLVVDGFRCRLEEIFE